MDKKQKLKAAAALRAKLSLKQQFERIDYKLDVIEPTLAALESGKAVLELPENSVLDIQVENENPNPEKN